MQPPKTPRFHRPHRVHEGRQQRGDVESTVGWVLRVKMLTVALSSTLTVTQSDRYSGVNFSAVAS